MINSHHILSCRLIKQHTVYVGRIQQNISHLLYLLGHFLIYHLCQTCWQKCRKIVEVDIFQVNFPSLHNIMCQTHLFGFLRCICMGILSVNIGKQNHLLVHNVSNSHFVTSQDCYAAQKSSTPYISTIGTTLIILAIYSPVASLLIEVSRRGQIFGNWFISHTFLSSSVLFFNCNFAYPQASAASNT